MNPIPRMRGRHPQVARNRELGPAAERVAVERGDHRDGEGADGVERPACLDRHARRLFARAQGGQLVEVAAGREALVAGSPEDHDPDRVIVRAILEDGLQGRQGRQAERVALLGTVDDDIEPRVTAVDDDELPFGSGQ